MRTKTSKVRYSFVLGFDAFCTLKIFRKKNKKTRNFPNSLIYNLPNSIPSFTGRLFDSMLFASLIAEHPSPFLYKLSKNLVPSLFITFQISTVWVLHNRFHCLKYILYCFLVLDAQESKVFRLQCLKDFCYTG